jgi:hypothetical protein
MAVVLFSALPVLAVPPLPGSEVGATPGDPCLPPELQKAHMEIRPGPDMTRNQFKKVIKKFEPSEP